MKICASCGASLPDGAAFCISCGSKEFTNPVMPDLNAPEEEKPKIEYDQYGRPIGQQYQQPEYEQPHFAVGFEDHVEYALEGSVFIAGAAIQWLRDELSVISTAAESSQYAERVPDSAGGYVVPAFTGLGAPYWNQRARGAIVGLTRGFNRAHLIRATLESLAYQTYDVVRAMERDAGTHIGELKVDGGACANNFLMQFQSDLIGSDVVRPRCIETTALGAAYLAGLAVGYWQSLDDVKNNWSVDRVFTSTLEEEKRIKLLNGWHKAVKCALLWSEEE